MILCLTAPLSVDNKTIYSDGYSFKEGCAADTLEVWRFLLLRSLSTDKSSLKFNCWERVQVCQATKLHAREERCNARAHKLGNLPLETCSCWKANQKAWRNLTAGRLASLPPPPLLLSSEVEGISMTGAYRPGSISILLYLSCSYRLLWKRLEAYAIQIGKMHINICLNVGMCVGTCVYYSSYFWWCVSRSVLHSGSWFHQSVVTPLDIRSIKLILKEQKYQVLCKFCMCVREKHTTPVFLCPPEFVACARVCIFFFCSLVYCACLFVCRQQ